MSRRTLTFQPKLVRTFTCWSTLGNDFHSWLQCSRWNSSCCLRRVCVWRPFQRTIAGAPRPLMESGSLPHLYMRCRTILVFVSSMVSLFLFVRNYSIANWHWSVKQLNLVENYSSFLCSRSLVWGDLWAWFSWSAWPWESFAGLMRSHLVTQWIA